MWRAVLMRAELIQARIQACNNQFIESEKIMRSSPKKFKTKQKVNLWESNEFANGAVNIESFKNPWRIATLQWRSRVVK